MSGPSDVNTFSIDDSSVTRSSRFGVAKRDFYSGIDTVFVSRLSRICPKTAWKDFKQVADFGRHSGASRNPAAVILSAAKDLASKDCSALKRGCLLAIAPKGTKKALLHRAERALRFSLASKVPRERGFLPRRAQPTSCRLPCSLAAMLGGAKSLERQRTSALHFWFILSSTNALHKGNVYELLAFGDNRSDRSGNVGRRKN
ncbi:MAG: hypothetical protein AABY95_11375 [Pseudomonadota bacterium]